jgi:hypothetical protein
VGEAVAGEPGSCAHSRHGLAHSVSTNSGTMQKRLIARRTIKSSIATNSIRDGAPLDPDTINDIRGLVTALY